MTLTCYLDVENFVQPACITKDLNLVFYARDSKISFQRSLTNLIYSGTFKWADSYSVSGLYRMTIILGTDQSKSLFLF